MKQRDMKQKALEDVIIHGCRTLVSTNDVNSFIIPRNSLLIDCHSFPSDLSDVSICIGFNEDESKPSAETLDIIYSSFKESGICKIEYNKPYSNSFTPIKPVDYKSVMIEINKSVYMNEQSLALLPTWYKIGNIINKMYKRLLNE